MVITIGLLTLTTIGLLTLTSTHTDLESIFNGPRFTKHHHISNNNTLAVNAVDPILMEELLVHNISKLPKWMVKYFRWHREHRNHRWNESNWKDYRYLVLACTKTQKNCGGTSDRLKPIPFLLRVAYETKRLFFIRWTRPYPLQEFLEPHQVNWSVPAWFEKILDQEKTKASNRASDIFYYAQKKERYPILQGQIHKGDGAEAAYEDEFDEETNAYGSFFHDMFRILFKPAPEIAQLVQDQFNGYGLVPGQYSVAHYRANYPPRDNGPEKIRLRTQNALNCASRLFPGYPIYFASDNMSAVNDSQTYAKATNRSIFCNSNPGDPIHLDFADPKKHPVSDFYNIFVDLYVMGSGRCISYGQGGFGSFAQLLSYNASCVSQHYNGHKMKDCEWKEPKR